MRMLGHGRPASLGFVVSLRAQSAAELRSRNYARHHNQLGGAESAVSTNHGHSPAIYPGKCVTGNTFVAQCVVSLYAVCHRQGGTPCGSLRSTSLAASSRAMCMLADRCSTSAHARSAGARRSCAIRARPDPPLEVCSVYRGQDPDQTRLDAHEHVDQRRRGAA